MIDFLGVRKRMCDIVYRAAKKSLDDTVGKSDETNLLKNISSHNNVELQMNNIEMKNQESKYQIQTNNKDIETQEVKIERMIEAQFVEAMNEIEKKNREHLKEVSSLSSSIGNNAYLEEKKSLELHL